jgi:hypothetical protein
MLPQHIEIANTNLKFINYGKKLIFIRDFSPDADDECLHGDTIFVSIAAVSP